MFNSLKKKMGRTDDNSYIADIAWNNVMVLREFKRSIEHEFKDPKQSSKIFQDLCNKLNVRAVL